MFSPVFVSANAPKAYKTPDKYGFLSKEEHNDLQPRLLHAINLYSNGAAAFQRAHKLSYPPDSKDTCYIDIYCAILACYGKSDRYKLKKGQLILQIPDYTPLSCYALYQRDVLSVRYECLEQLRMFFRCSGSSVVAFPPQKEMTDLLNNCMLFEVARFTSSINSMQDQVNKHQNTHPQVAKLRNSFDVKCQLYKEDVDSKFAEYKANCTVNASSNTSAPIAFHRLYKDRVFELETTCKKHYAIIKGDYAYLVGLT